MIRKGKRYLRFTGACWTVGRGSSNELFLADISWSMKKHINIHHGPILFQREKGNNLVFLSLLHDNHWSFGMSNSRLFRIN